MLQLVLVSLLWAFSFGLIKQHLGGVDSTFVATARLGLALVIFLPFLRLRGISARLALALGGIGAVQFGVMYLAYIESFRYLRGYEVALFTLPTPIFVTLFADAFDRHFRWRALVAAALAVVAAALVVKKTSQPLAGVALVQLSNAAFALGQVLYKRLFAAHPGLGERDVFGLLYAAAFAVGLAALCAKGVYPTLNAAQVWTLLYLGVLASGLGFFLWNSGATCADAGTLAVMNNAKVPLAVTVSLLIFGEQASVPLLLASFSILAFAVWFADRERASRRANKPL